MSVLPPFQSQQLLREYSTFGIGGEARLFVEVTTISQMKEVLSYCHREKIPFFILGKGSNCLFDDRGWNGLVILNKITHLSIQDNCVEVGAGFSFSLLGIKTAKLGLGGLEFASGIPATVGGAVFMNAGANGAETKDCLHKVFYINEQGEEEMFYKEDLTFSYRFSSFQKKNGAIVSVSFILNHSSEAREKQLEIISYRTRTQPYSDPSIGCIFKNPKSQSAGALIEKSGLKGRKVGGAVVSLKHANFIINAGGATAEDVKCLALLIQEEVEKQTGVILDLEMRCIPYTN